MAGNARTAVTLQEQAAAVRSGEQMEDAPSAGNVYALQLARIKRSVLSRYARRRPANFHLLEKAFTDAEFHHRNQWRKSGEPYILHPARVALQAAEAGCDLETTIIALLHDVIEDTEVTKEEMRTQYGDWLADVVDGLTKVVEAPGGSGRDPIAVATYRKLISSTIKDVRTVQVKIFDRLDNMRDLGYLSRTAQRRISTETMNVYVPMAQRLGMQTIADELTALAFRYLYPRRFARTLAELKRRINDELLKANSLKHSLESLLTDLNGHGATVEPQFRQVSDYIHEDKPIARALAGFRIRVPDREDCYRALGVLHMRYRVVPNSIKDFISNPKPNRYQALHSEIFVAGEAVPICTVSDAMEKVNATGILAGWEGSQEDLSKYYESYLDLLDHYSGNDDLRMEDVLRHAQMETLQLLTPKGALLSFPQGATVLDFAFAIHSDIGVRCDGARMGGRRVSRFEELVDGEVVEVLTNPGVAPTQAWLEHVRTTRAKLAIRRFLNAQANARAQEVGRRLFEAELRRLGRKPEEVLEAPAFREALEARSLSTGQFFQQVGKDRIPIRRFLLDQDFVSEADLQRRENQEHSLLTRFMKPMLRSPDPVLRVQDLEEGFIRMGECCAPLLGDPIVGVQDETGITIHRTHCPALEQTRSEALINVGWEQDPGKRAYRLNILVGEDRPGLLYKISKVMRDAKVNILDIGLHRKARSGGADVQVFLEPIAFKTFRTVVSRLRDIKEVRRITNLDVPTQPTRR